MLFTRETIKKSSKPNGTVVTIDKIVFGSDVSYQVSKQTPYTKGEFKSYRTEQGAIKGFARLAG